MAECLLELVTARNASSQMAGISKEEKRNEINQDGDETIRHAARTLNLLFLINKYF